MGAEFNPYHHWLGLSPANVSPNFYELLGVRIYESDRSTIAAASEQRVALLRQMQTGEQADAAQKLIAEVVHARNQLLDEDARREYESFIQSQYAAPVQQPVAFTNPTAPLGNDDSTNAAIGQLGQAVSSQTQQAKEAKPKSKRRRSNDESGGWGLIVALIASALTGSIGVGVFMLMRHSPPNPEESRRTVTHEESTNTDSNREAPSRKSSGLKVLQPVDLVSLVDPAKHTLIGGWRKDGPSLVTAEPEECMAVIPYDSPDNFRISLRAKRINDRGGFRMFIPWRGKSIFLSSSMSKTGISLDGKYPRSIRETREGNLFEVGRIDDVEITILGDKFSITKNREPFYELTLEPSRLTPPAHEFETKLLSNRDAIYLGTYQAEFEFESAVLTPTAANGSTMNIDLSVDKLFQGHRYRRLPSEEFTWWQAVKKCEELGGHLVCIESNEELAFLRDNVLVRRPTWIGGMRRNEKSPFKWISGADMTLTNWWKDVDNRAASFLMVDGSKASLRDRHASSRLGLVCEWESTELPSSPAKTSFLDSLTPRLVDSQIGEPKTFSGHTYAIIKAPVTWRDAKLICEQMGGHLVCVESEPEQQFLNSVIQQGHRYWMGGTDEADEGRWVWLTGDPIELDHWSRSNGKRAPDNWGYRGAEHSLQLFWPKEPKESVPAWTDHIGQNRVKAICEWDSLQVAYLDRAKKPAPKQAAVAKPIEIDTNRRKAIIDELLKRHEEDLNANDRTARAAVAARWLSDAANEGDITRKHVMLDLSAKLAVKNSAVALGFSAQDSLEQLDPSTRSVQRKLTLLADAINRIEPKPQSVWDVQEILAVGSKLIAESRSADELDSLDRMYASLERSARKLGTQLSREVLRRKAFAETAQKMLPALLAAEKSLSANPSDKAALNVVGKHQALLGRDWPAAIESLSLSDSGDLATAAQALKQSPEQYASQLAMGNALWDLADSADEKSLSELHRDAARVWLRKALLRSDEKDRTSIESRLGFTPTRSRPSGAFAIKTNGLAGLKMIGPLEPATGAVRTSAGFAEAAGRFKITYPALPTPEFVCAVDFEMLAPEGTLTFDFGRHEFGKLTMSWDPDKRAFQYHLHHHWGGTYFHGPKGPVRVGERVALKLFVRPGDWQLYRGEKLLGKIGPPGEDLRLSISGGEKCRTRIHHCEFRPLSLGDPLKPLSVESEYDTAESTKRILAKQLELPKRPSEKTPNAFVIESTGTPMRWIPPGKFTKEFGGGKQSTVEITRGFWMGAHEFSQHEWLRLSKINPSRSIGSRWLPVDGVAWTNISAFIAELNKREQKARRLPNGFVYRLPTEMEWEYACRAGVPDRHSIPVDKFWNRDTTTYVREVGQSMPNAWGLYDMHGNVSELCLDAYQEFPQEPPANIRDRFIPPQADTSLFVQRGGHWWRGPDDCGSESRKRKENIPAAHCGFRLVLARN